MTDPWSTEEDEDWTTAEDAHARKVRARSSAAAPLRRMVRELLERELEARRDRSPHAQLGVVVGADQRTVHGAFMRLRAQFDPREYDSHGPEAVALAGEISALVNTAFLILGAPHADEHRRPGWLARLFRRAKQ